MIQLKQLQVLCASGVRNNARKGHPQRLTDLQIAQLADCKGTLVDNGTRWRMDYGESKTWFCVTADVEPELQEPAFESPVHPIDQCGVPIQPGRYVVTRPGTKAAAVRVYESESDCELWVVPYPTPVGTRPWKLAEMSRECDWEPIATEQTA